jgi:penicillin-insensitive murein endopeptidase
MSRAPAVLFAIAAGTLVCGDSIEARSYRSRSVSCGSANKGSLSRAAALPIRGWAHRIPRPWSRRGRRYGSTQLVRMLRRAAARVARRYPGSILGVADMSSRRGGATGGHRSHQSGRDVDLLYYAIDRRGRMVRHDHFMPIYDSYGRATSARRPTASKRIPERFFDLARNWALVKAMLNDPDAEVQYIFVAQRIEKWLLAYARATGERRALISQAARVMMKPTHDAGHDDHMHVRVRCSDRDVSLGRCSDSNAPHRKGGAWRTRVRCPTLPRIVLPGP